MDVVEIAKKLIQFETVTPKGSDCLDFIQQYLEALGFKATRLPFSDVDNLFARKGEGSSHPKSPHLMYVGHVDVVPPGDGWTHDPFSATVVGDTLYGRGAVDMKGSIAAFLAAVANIQTNGPISLLLTSDEEGPGKDGVVKVIPWLKENNQVPDCALVGEPTSVEVVADTIKNGRRGSLSFDIETFGAQGHVAYPHLANNAANPLITLLNVLKSTRLDDGNGDFDPSNLEIVKLNLPNNAYNVIPGVAYASVNIRFNTLHSFDTLTAHINKAAKEVGEQFGACFIIKPFLPYSEPFLSSAKEWGDKVAEAVKTVTGGNPVFSTSGGTSDARFIHKICPVVELGLVNKTAHHVDEHVAIEDLRTLQRVYEQVFG